MSTSDPRIDSILAALEKFSSSLCQQLDFNQQTDQRIATLMNRLDQFESSQFDNLETLLKAAPSNSKSTPSDESTPQVTAGSHHLNLTPRPDAIDTSMVQQPKLKSTWASIASKPPAPLNDRKRQALHRFFNPPVNDSIQNGSYTFVYISRSRRMNRSQIRSKFHEISIDNLRVLDLNFPACNTIGILLHEVYLPEFQSKLLEIDAHLIQDFDPLDHHHVADPKYQGLSEERRTQLAKALHQNRCIRSLYFIRPHFVPSVAKYFIRKGWVSSHAAQDIINQRLRRPVKRRPDPHSAVAHTLQTSQPSGFSAQASFTLSSASQVPPTATLQDWYGNPVSTQDMDTTPDFASNASGSESSRPSSPISDVIDLPQ
ncbi:uncharacterized protein ATC70_001542 [Mucor velutinosus]|uniref:Uncharacterized protein n=1 Tax=Mucor velutinosus TaxID=708070 RepID=A0AAN7DIQ2_9FUNG|nr:hypothetical protein ATC70_001542 [Mucor velutinosus]